MGHDAPQWRPWPLWHWIVRRTTKPWRANQRWDKPWLAKGQKLELNKRTLVGWVIIRMWNGATHVRIVLPACISSVRALATWLASPPYCLPTWCWCAKPFFFPQEVIGSIFPGSSRKYFSQEVIGSIFPGSIPPGSSRKYLFPGSSRKGFFSPGSSRKFSDSEFRHEDVFLWRTMHICKEREMWKKKCQWLCTWRLQGTWMHAWVAVRIGLTVVQ